MVNSAYKNVLLKLNKFTRKYYTNELIKGAIIALSISLISFLVVILLEYAGNFGYLTRMILFYTLVIIVLLCVVKLIVFPLLKLYKLGDSLTKEQAAILVGKHFKQIDDRLLNVIQLNNNSSGESLELLNASIEQKSAQISPFDFSNAISFKSNKKFLKYLVPTLLFLLIIGIFSPKILKNGTNRIVNYNKEFVKELPYNITLENENLSIVEGENIKIKISVNGDVLPQNLFIKFNNNDQKMVGLSKSTFAYQLQNLRTNTPFVISDGENSLGNYLIEVLSKPVLVDFNVTLNYPSYIKKKPETLSSSGDLLIPEGTVAKWSFKANKTTDASIIFNDSIYKTGINNKKLFVASKTFFQSEVYTLLLTNGEHNTSDSIQYAVQVIKDEYPNIKINEMRDSTNLANIYFSGLVNDDYGFKNLLFNYKIRNDNNTVVSDSVSVIPVSKTTTSYKFSYMLNIDNINLQAGDKLEYYFTIYDNDAVNGSKKTNSKIAVFEIPSKSQLKENKDRSNDKVKDNLEESISDAKKIQSDLEKLRKEMLQKKKAGWEEKNKLDAIKEKQKELKKKLSDLTKESQKTLNEQKKFGEMDEKLLEKQQQIQELMENVLNDELKQMMEDIQKMMEELDKNKETDEKMEDLTFNNEEIEQSLDRTLELFKQLELEQKLQENINELKKLADEQKKLADETKAANKDKKEELLKKQEELNKKTEELKKDIEKANQLNDELEFKNDLPENSEQEMSDAQKDQKKAQEDISKGDKKSASDSQKDAGDKMEQLAEKMEQAQQKMQEDAQTENLEDMRQLLENLVDLSFSQEELMKDISETSIKDPKFRKLVQQQLMLRDDADMIKDSLFALSKREPKVEPIVTKEINELNVNMAKSLKLLEDRSYSKGLAQQQKIMTNANNLALLFDEAIQQMQKQQAQQKQGGSGSCSKPGGKGKPSAGSIKKMQQQLSKQLSELKEELGKQQGGKKEGGQEGSKAGNSQKLAKMAAEQEAIRRELQKMSNSLNNEGGKTPGGSNLKKIEDLMEENERDIVNRQITQETINRQKDILTRLLESEKAERERDKDEKRESNESNFAEERNLDEFLRYKDLKKLGEDEILQFTSPKLKDFYKNKVNRYLNNID